MKIRANSGTWVYFSKLAAFTAASMFLFGCGSASKPKTAGANSAPVGPVQVSTATAAAREVPVTIRSTGSFVADESSGVAPQVSGQVIATPVNVGDYVKTGEVIARLDDRDARLKLQQAQASVQQAEASALNAEAEAKRYAGLVQTGDVSQSTYEKLTTQVQTAQATAAQSRAQVSIAQKALNDAVIRAPFSGYVSARSVSAGEYVTTASTIATIVRIQPIKLEIQVRESDAAKIKNGMSIVAHVPAFPDQDFEGKVSAINPSLNPDSRVLRVEAKFANRDSKLSPGMFATADVLLNRKEQAIFVPKDAIFSPTDSTSFEAYVVKDGKARIRIIQPADLDGEMIRVLSGIAAGDVVATSNLKQLFDGISVQAQ